MNKKKISVIIVAIVIVIGVILYMIIHYYNNRTIAEIRIDNDKLLIQREDNDLCDATYFIDNVNDEEKESYIMQPECISLREVGSQSVTIQYKNSIRGFTITIIEK